jgi:hypothetical protein
MRKYIVNNTRSITNWVDSRNKFDYSPATRLTKKQRARSRDALGLLKGLKLLTPERVAVQTFETVTLDIRDIDRFIYQHCLELLQQFGPKDFCVAIGSAQFYELSHQMTHQPLFISLADFQVGRPQNTLRGMSLIVLPWMDGIVCIPKEYLPIQRELVPSGVLVTPQKQRELDEVWESLHARRAWHFAMGRPIKDAPLEDDE